MSKITGIIIALFTLASVSASAAEKPKQLTIFTSVSGSSWYGIGAGMAEIFAKNGVQSNPELGAGLSNIANVTSGKGELGFTMTPAMTVAYNGEAPFSAPIKNAVVIAALSESLMHVIVNGEKGFKTISDLKGHPFVTQAPGSITAVVFKKLIESYGMSESDLKLKTGSLTEQQDALKDRRSDGMVSIASYPSSWGAELAQTIPVTFLPVPDAAYEKLKAILPTVGKGVIKAGTYKGQPDDVPTVTAKMIIVGSADMSDDNAYWVAKTLSENIEQVHALHASFKTLTVAEMADVPGGGLHPGAAKYFREVGALK